MHHELTLPKMFLEHEPVLSFVTIPPIHAIKCRVLARLNAMIRIAGGRMIAPLKMDK